ncbi:MAG: 50S ribosomal protein L11 methyltransferase, partial [Bacteroidetes bacterium]
MEYTELKITLNPNTVEYREIIIAELANINFESFNETDKGISAYIKSELFDNQKIKQLFF